MKRYLHALCMCFSMFCALPTPLHIWKEEARPLMLLFLPFVGGVIGGIWALGGWIMQELELPALMQGAILCSLPFLLTGCIHLDGYMDVCDAVGSCRDMEQRRRILKDPHVGSFSVIYCILLILGQFALLCSKKAGAPWWPLLLIPVTSRICAGFAITLLRPMSTSEYAGVYRRGIRCGHLVWFGGLFAVVCSIGFALGGLYGMVVPVSALGYALSILKPIRALGGMSGDISGYGLTLGELAGLFIYILL